MKKLYLISITSVMLFTSSCNHSRKFTQNYYNQNVEIIDNIRQNFQRLNDEHPFSLELKDQSLSRIGLEIITDSIKYIYTFDLNEHFLVDTLLKYRFDVRGMGDLILAMQQAHCTWITNLDYYEERKKKELIFLSVRHKALKEFLRSDKYFTLALFNEPQPFDEKKRLLDKEGLQRFRKIHGKIYRSLHPDTFYAITENYR